MSLESTRVKVQTEHEAQECACSVKREPALGPELMHAPDVACTRGTSAATCLVKQELIVKGPSDERPGIETEMSVQPKHFELELEVECVKEEEPEVEELWCEVAPRAGLYSEHAVNRELVQPPDNAILAVSGRSASLRAASQALAACPGEGPRCSKSRPEQRARETCSSESISTDKRVYTRKERREKSASTPHLQNVPEVLPSKAPLRQRKKTHTVDRPHKCHVCHKFYKSSINLRIHSRIHTGEKPHACDVCKQQFAHKHHLKVHKLIHTREKPYTCDFCNKQFTHLSSILNHKRIHTGERPYACDICNKKFTQIGAFTKHKSVHTGEKPYACNICNKKFSRKDSLTVHARSKHHST